GGGGGGVRSPRVSGVGPAGRVGAPPVGLLSAPLGLPAAALSAPPWQRGEEFTYAGTVTEAVDRTANRFRRTQDLEVRVLVLERRDGWADIAVLTLLRRVGDPDPWANPDRAPNPPAARLDLVRVHEDGTVHLLT